MSPTTHDEIETRLRELFERQADALSVDARAWNDPPMATVSTFVRPRRSRSATAAILTAAAAVALVLGVIAVAPDHHGVFVAGRPGVPAPLSFTTLQVSFATDGMTIDAGGNAYTAAATTVDVNSDPGTPNKYTTLELAWTERGVEMRLFMYFTSDGHDWWANEIRTYNGKSPGDWIEYMGTYFRMPLGAAFTGNADLRATEGGGRLQLSNLHLQAFLPPVECKNATSTYAVHVGYDHVAMPDDPTSGFGLGVPEVLDTTTCNAVADPHAFQFDLTFTRPGIAAIDEGDGVLRSSATDFAVTDGIQLTREAAGSTVLRVTARERSTGKIVDTADIPVTVG